MNRLTTSRYGEGISYASNVNRYREIMAYDKNGNILKLLRSGQIATGSFGRLDSLTFKYTGMGNQVRSIADSVPDVAGRGDFYDATNGYTNKEYYYDKNGNMWLDRNKRMKTVYNYLNLPARVSDTITPANKIEYVYTSAGEKLKQRLTNGTTLLYFGNYVYTLNGTPDNIEIKYILTQEGRATNSAGIYTYEYFMKDHLGSTRVSFNVPSTTAVIVQQDDYYPFGMMHQPRVTTTSDNRYLFNGKEFQNNLLGGVNLDLYDYGARFYDPQIGRWSVIDHSAEKDPSYSPYCYAANNPIRYIDPDGRWFDDKNEKKAERIVQRTERRGERLDSKAERLEAKGKDATDLRARSSELRQMGQDIKDMGQSNTEFRFANANDKSNIVRDKNGNGLPVTARTGKNQVTMYMQNANNLHEPRHGGQIAKGEFNVLDPMGTPSSSYGASHEVSAYRAEYSYTGSLSFVPAIDLSNPQNLLLLGQGQGTKAFEQSITSIGQITNDLLKVFVDQPGINQQYIYRNNPAGWWLK